MATQTDVDRRAIALISSVARKSSALWEELRALNKVIEKSQIFAPRRQYLKKVEQEVSVYVNTLENIEISMKQLR